MKMNLNKSGLSNNVGYFSRWDRHLLSFTHELSSPLTAAQINLDDYLLSGNLNGLKLLSSNLKLMEDYLNTARLQIKHQPLKNSLFSVKKQLNLIVRSLSSLARKRGVVLVLNLDEDLAIKGNSTSFKQITSCVIKNAIESYGDDSASRPVMIEAAMDKDYLVISVRDNAVSY